MKWSSRLSFPVCLSVPLQISGCSRHTHTPPKHLPTHTYRGHQSSLNCFIHLLRTIIPVQSTRLTVFFRNLSPSFLWSTSWPGTLHFILHTFLHPIIVFLSQHNPYHRHLICCSIKIMLPIPGLSLDSLLGIFYLNATHPSYHSHLCPLKCHLIFLSYGPGLTSMQHTTSHTTALQSPSRDVPDKVQKAVKWLQ